MKKSFIVYAKQVSAGAYYDFYRLSAVQRAFLIPYFGIQGFLDPTKGDAVAGLGDVTSTPSLLRSLHADMMRSSSGIRLLEEKPLITSASLNLPRLRLLSSNTLGKQYATYMDEHCFSADDRSIVRFAENPKLAYVLARYRQVHDFWHVLADLPPTILGEVALKCLEYRITGLPVSLLSGSIGQLRLRPSELKALYQVYLPWIYKTAIDDSESFEKPHVRLLSYYYEENLEKYVDEVRRELGFTAAPKINS